MAAMEGIEMRDFALEALSAKGNQTQASKQDDRAPVATSDERSWLRRFWTTHVRITIDEEESRDHLALERTFLAYVRTASAYAQFGITLAQLFRLNTGSSNVIKPVTLRIGSALGATTLGIAILVSICGAAYFAKQQMGLMKGNIVSRGWEVWILAVVSFVLFCIVLGLLAGVDRW